MSRQQSKTHCLGKIYMLRLRAVKCFLDFDDITKRHDVNSFNLDLTHLYLMENANLQNVPRYGTNLTIEFNL